MTTPGPLTAHVSIALNAVIVAVEDDRPKVMCVQSSDIVALPYGPFDPDRHRTFEIGMREWVERQTELNPGYIEQLYTFGDAGRETPAAAIDGAGAHERIISVGYLALVPEPASVIAQGAVWKDWYAFFPWEDWRTGAPEILGSKIIPALFQWAKTSPRQLVKDRNYRIAIAFGQDGFGWEEERSLDRFELMYEAGLVAEAARDRGHSESTINIGIPMISDHRRILATALGRVRGKLKYRPVIFQLMPSEFTLLALQRRVEAVIGFSLHKQNFRRTVEKSGFVQATGDTVHQTSGRPAALFRLNEQGKADRATTGLSLPRKRPAPDAR